MVKFRTDKRDGHKYAVEEHGGSISGIESRSSESNDREKELLEFASQNEYPDELTLDEFDDLGFARTKQFGLDDDRPNNEILKDVLDYQNKHGGIIYTQVDGDNGDRIYVKGTQTVNRTGLWEVVDWKDKQFKELKINNLSKDERTKLYNKIIEQIKREEDNVKVETIMLTPGVLETIIEDTDGNQYANLKYNQDDQSLYGHVNNELYEWLDEIDYANLLNNAYVH